MKMEVVRFICDRCGREIPPDWNGFSFDCQAGDSNLQIPGIQDLKFYVQATRAGNGLQAMDLCPECEASLAEEAIQAYNEEKTIKLVDECGDARLLTYFAFSKRENVRFHVAMNTNTPPGVLDLLADDFCLDEICRQSMCTFIVENPNVGEKTLLNYIEKLSDVGELSGKPLLLKILNRTDLPEAVLKKISNLPCDRYDTKWRSGYVNEARARLSQLRNE